MRYKSLSDEARQFMTEKGTKLVDSQSPATLVTSSEHSVVKGRVTEATHGGIVFTESETFQRFILPWENVDELIEIPTLSAGSVQYATAGRR